VIVASGDNWMKGTSRETTAPAQLSVVVCLLCGETHPPAVGCDPEWRVVRIWGFDLPTAECPRYYVASETPETEPDA